MNEPRFSIEPTIGAAGRAQVACPVCSRRFDAALITGVMNQLVEHMDETHTKKAARERGH